MRISLWWMVLALSGCKAEDAEDDPGISTTEQPAVVIGNYYGIVQSLNPVGYWRLGELSGTTMVDSSATPTNGTYTGSFYRGQPGAVAVDNNTSVWFSYDSLYTVNRGVIPDRNAYSLTQDYDFYSRPGSSSSGVTWGAAPDGVSWVCDLECSSTWYGRGPAGAYISPAPWGTTFQQGRPNTNLRDGEMQIRVKWMGHATDGPLSPVAFVARYVDSANYVRAELIESPTTHVLTIKLIETVNGVHTVLATGAVGSEYDVDTWYFLRFRFDGTQLSARAWNEGLTQPSVWNVQATVSGTPSTGRVALRSTNTFSSVRPTVYLNDFWVQAAGFTHSMFVYVSSNQYVNKTFPFGKAKHEDEWSHDNDEYYFRYHHDERALKSYVFNLSGGLGAGVSADWIDRDKWHHVVTTLDNGDWHDPNAGITMWFDGRNITDSNHSGRKYGSYDGCVDACDSDNRCHNSTGASQNCWMITPLNGNHPLTVGTTGDGGAYQFNGALDEVAVFNRKLTASQIQDLYNSSCQPSPNGKMGGLTATATSSEGTQYAASNAVDGSLDTRWSSNFSDSNSITVDLGSSRAVAQIRLYWETAYASEYDVLVSDNGIVFDWVKRVKKANANPDSVNLYRNARYIRMKGVTRATQWGYSIWEFEVFPCDRVPIP